MKSDFFALYDALAASVTGTEPVAAVHFGERWAMAETAEGLGLAMATPGESIPPRFPDGLAGLRLVAGELAQQHFRKVFLVGRDENLRERDVICGARYRVIFIGGEREHGRFDGLLTGRETLFRRDAVLFASRLTNEPNEEIVDLRRVSFDVHHKNFI